MHRGGRAREQGSHPELPDQPFSETSGRKEAKRLTGKSTVPVLVTDDGEVVADSKNIVAWAKDNPAAGAERVPA